MNDYLAWASSEIVDAAITNANVHGAASHVWITVALDPDTDPDLLVVTVADEGSGPPADVVPGLGLDGLVALVAPSASCDASTAAAAFG